MDLSSAIIGEIKSILINIEQVHCHNKNIHAFPQANKEITKQKMLNIKDTSLLLIFTVLNNLTMTFLQNTVNFKGAKTRRQYL